MSIKNKNIKTQSNPGGSRDLLDKLKQLSESIAEISSKSTYTEEHVDKIPYVTVIFKFILLIVLIIAIALIIFIPDLLDKTMCFYIYSIIRLFLRIFISVYFIYIVLFLYRRKNKEKDPEFLGLLAKGLIKMPFILILTLTIMFFSITARIIYMKKCDGNKPNEWFINYIFDIIFFCIILLIFVIFYRYVKTNYKKFDRRNFARALMTILFITSIMYFLLMLFINSFEEAVADIGYFWIDENEPDCEENDVSGDNSMKKIFYIILSVIFLLLFLVSVAFFAIPHPSLVKIGGKILKGTNTQLNKAAEELDRKNEIYNEKQMLSEIVQM